MSSIYNIYAMTRRLIDAADAIHLVPPGGSVALKPNIVVAGHLDDGATTHEALTLP